MAHKEKILLTLLPFWTPLIPPVGISCLKSYLQHYGYPVKTVDANTEDDLNELYHNYFDLIKEHVPGYQQGNFYSIGHDVLRNHMMAHLHYKDEKKYRQLVKILGYNTFYVDFSEPVVSRLNDIIAEFYVRFEKYFLELLEREQPALLGLSVFSGTLPASLFAAELTRKKYPHIKIVMGGGVFADQLAPGTPNMEYFLERAGSYIDNIIIGEGEILFLKYLRQELPRSQKIFTLDDIDWRTLDLATAGIPDYSDLDIEGYTDLAAYTSRSCPFQCSFCSETVQWGKYRKKSPRQIVKEFSELYKRHDSQLLFMSDSLLNPVITGLAEEFVRSEISIYWDGCIRADKNACDPAKTHLWRRGGYYRARLGMESGSQKVLDLMGKKITPAEIKDSLVSLANAGIKTSTLWVIGHPGETEEDFRQTLDLIADYKEYIYDVEGTPFWYHLKGQSRSDEWMKKNKSVLLYPQWAKEMLVAQTWIIACEPQREEIYSRLHRFSEHLDKLGIPNPYSMQEIYAADKRWQKLHKNAVPSLVEFKNRGNYIDECKKVKEISTVYNRPSHDGQWGF